MNQGVSSPCTTVFGFCLSHPCPVLNIHNRKEGRKDFGGRRVGLRSLFLERGGAEGKSCLHTEEIDHSTVKPPPT